MAKKKGVIVDHSKIEKDIWQLAEPLCESCGGELIDVEFVQEAGSWYLRIFIDREEMPVDHELCEQVSQLISDALDIADPISQSYYLEISSPGLERPLKREKDFQRYAGYEVMVRLYAPMDGKKEFQGALGGLENGELVLNTPEGVFGFSAEQIAKVHLVADF